MDPDAGSTPEKFNRLKEAVLSKRPVLKEILERHGDKNLFQYALEYISVNIPPAIKERQEEFLGTLKQEVSRLLGDEVGESVANQLREYYFVSTADHHGPLTSPFFLSGNLLMSAPYKDLKDPKLQNVIALACANVSLNNSSFPRGLLFHSYANGKTDLHRLSFLPSNSHSSTVYNYRPYNEADLKKMKTLLNEKVNGGLVKKTEQDQLVQLLDEVYASPKALAAKNYSDQVTITNFDLWKRYFAKCKHKHTPPNLVYLEQETLVVRLLIDHHLYRDTVVQRILFNPSYFASIAKYFENIMGAFCREHNYGTYFFWYIPEKNDRRIQLWLENDKLVAEGGGFEMPLTPEAIQKALDEKKIMPSMLTIFLVLSFYYGVKCLGGFSQVNYLTEMKNAYIKMNADLGNYRSIEMCARAQTKELCEFTTAFLQTPEGTIPATGLDLILHGDENTWDFFVDESKQITLGEAFSPLYPEFYRIIYAEGQRDAELMEVTDTDITRMAGLEQKIRPCAILKPE